MKSYTKATTLKGVEKLLNFASEHNCEIFTAEGALNDFHIIKNTCNIKVGNIRPRKYIVCYYTYRNCYSNDLYMLFTDDIVKVNTMAAYYGLDESVYDYNI